MNALFQREATVLVKFNKKVDEKLLSKEFFENLIRDYQVNVSIDDYQFEVHGRTDDVRRVKEFIDIEMRIYRQNAKLSSSTSTSTTTTALTSTSTSTSTSTTKTETVTEKSSDKSKNQNNSSDSVIYIDPYETFNEDDDEDLKSAAQSVAETSQKNRMDTNDDSVIILDDNRTIFTKSALAQGFIPQQIDQVCDELIGKIDSMSLVQFMQHLRGKVKTVNFFLQVNFKK